MTALTSELLRERTSVLFDQILRASDPEHPPEEIAFEVVTCDGCGCVCNLLLGPPVGWTTTGDFERGFTDLCRGCSSHPVER
jgi:hypothetical protein